MFGHGGGSKIVIFFVKLNFKKKLKFLDNLLFFNEGMNFPKFCKKFIAVVLIIFKYFYVEIPLTANIFLKNINNFF